MDPEDLLYTNRFTKTGSLSRSQIESDANNFIPYRTLKNETVNNVRDELQQTFNTSNPITDSQLRAFGWNKGEYGNQRPVLSDFARDIGENSYFRYKTSYINIDSRFRDIALYPNPNNYSMFLGRKYENIENIKLIDYFFPEMEYAINKTNNIIMWFTIPFDAISFSDGPGLQRNPFQITTGTLNVCSWYVDFNQLIDIADSCEVAIENLTNNIYKNLFKIEVPPGNYTTTELEKMIESLWAETQFYNSNFITTEPYSFWSPTSDPEKAFYLTPQLVKVRINPVTSEVDFTLRYEELRITQMTSYKGTNYFDIYLDTVSPYTEYNAIAQDDVYPLILTGFPGIGGVKPVIINYVEFITKYEFGLLTGGKKKTYFDIVKDGTGTPIPNVLRLYLYNVNNQEIIFSYSETYMIEDKCPDLCDARVGREAPFFFVTGDQSPLFDYLQQLENKPKNLNAIPPVCIDCVFDPEIDYCQYIIPPEIINKINKYICNTDGTSRILINLLGYWNTRNNSGILGPLLFARAIQGNIIYKRNTFISLIQTLSIITQNSLNYLQCKQELGEDAEVFIEYKSGKILDFHLPIIMNPDGSYSFILNNYIFMKLLNPQLENQITGSQIVQIKSTSLFAYGSSDIYEYDGGLKGYDVRVEATNQTNCNNPATTAANTNKVLTKDIDNLFAKIKFSPSGGSCEVNKAFTNELVYFDGNVTNLDQFVVQLVDFEGKLLEVSVVGGDHNFTLMVVEKIEVLKETNINSRTGFTNTSGTRVVQRNNFSM